jgi:hypothetical protein
VRAVDIITKLQQRVESGWELNFKRAGIFGCVPKN